MADPSPAATKDRIRQEAFLRRDALDRVFRRDAARAIAALALALSELADIQPVGGYWPIRSEVDPRPLMRRLLKRRPGRGAVANPPPAPELAPVAPGRPADQGRLRRPPRAPGPMHRSASRWRCSSRLPPSTERARLASATARAISTEPSRLYQKCDPVLTVGLAYGAQEIERVPGEAHDRRLDLIVTEAEVIAPLGPHPEGARSEGLSLEGPHPEERGPKG